MKNYTRTLVRDIKAAARIGHIESLWVAIDSLAQIPEVKGNHPLNETFLNQVILPTAQALSGPRVSKPALQPLLNSSLTAIRAVGSSALALRFLKKVNHTTLKDLRIIAKEPRKEVREAVVLACEQIAPDHPDKLTELVNGWLGQDSPRLQGIAIRLLPNLPLPQAIKKLSSLSDASLPKDPEIRAALARTVNTIGRRGAAEEVIRILRLWVDTPEDYFWVITRCLAKGWAADYPQEAMEILTILAEEKGPKKKIRDTLQAFSHNVAAALVRETILSWMNAEHPNLRAAGEDAYQALIEPEEN